MATTNFKVKKRPAILVPYDFGPKAIAALDEAIKITKYLKGEIYLLSVVRKGDFFSNLFRSEKESRKLIRETLVQLKDIAKKVKLETGTFTHITVEQGNPIEIILEQASLIGAQYIVMGKMEKSTIEFNFVGPNTLHVVGEAPCPVITVSANTIKEDGFKNIVLPIDLSKQTHEKVIKAISWAKYYNANIHLIGVLTGKIKSSNSRLAAKMEKAKWIVQQEGLECSAEVYEMSSKPIHQIILDHADKVNGDLLMIMTHQELSVVDNYIGAVAQKILKQADIPVISFTSKAVEDKNYFVSGFLPFQMLTNKKEIEYLRG